MARRHAANADLDAAGDMSAGGIGLPRSDTRFRRPRRRLAVKTYAGATRSALTCVISGFYGCARMITPSPGAVGLPLSERSPPGASAKADRLTPPSARSPVGWPITATSVMSKGRSGFPSFTTGGGCRTVCIRSG